MWGRGSLESRVGVRACVGRAGGELLQLARDAAAPAVSAEPPHRAVARSASQGKWVHEHQHSQAEQRHVYRHFIKTKITSKTNIIIFRIIFQNTLKNTSLFYLTFFSSWRDTNVKALFLQNRRSIYTYINSLFNIPRICFLFKILVTYWVNMIYCVKLI